LKELKSLYDSENNNLAQLIRRATSVEDSIKLCKAVFKLSGERGTDVAFTFPGFLLGNQTGKRSRMPVILDEFSEKDLLLQLLKENLSQIRKKFPNYAKGFRPNALIAFLVKPGGNLRGHVNEVTCKKHPHVAIWNFGCSVKYVLENPKDIENMDHSSVEYQSCKFNLKSQDFLIFDGVHVKHGYKKCKKDTFSSEGKVPLYIKSCDVNTPYRLGIVLMQFDEIGELLPYYYHGETQHEPLYETK
jgi:hypothetical protein